MQPTSLGDLFGHPVFLTLLCTVLFVIANIMVGVSMLPRDSRRKLYPLHRSVYVLVVISYGTFLAVNHSVSSNSVFHYGVFAYFLIVVPLTRRVHVTLHAVLASVGLVLLGVVAAVSI